MSLQQNMFSCSVPGNMSCAEFIDYRRETLDTKGIFCGKLTDNLMVKMKNYQNKQQPCYKLTDFHPWNISKMFT